MAFLPDIIRQVRRAMGDTDPPPSFRTSVLYPDEFYEDAIRFALNKLKSDLASLTTDSPPPLSWTLQTVPEVRTFLLVKLAIIQMAQIRGSESAGSVSVQSESLVGLTKVQLPNLTIEERQAADATSVGPAFWLKLLDRLQREYDHELAGMVATKAAYYGPAISMSMTRVSPRTGGVVSKQLDQGLPPTTLDAAYVAGTLTLSWQPIYATTFMYYELHHIAPGSRQSILATEWDNMVASREIPTTLGSGRHRFYVSVVNRNGIGAISNTVELNVT